jgi:hypothetical protein
MQLAPMRFTTIEGTSVAVNVTSAAEAKLAVKELRHRKRELKFLRGALAKRQKAARTNASKPKKKKTPSGVEMFLDDMRWGLSAVVGANKQASEQPRKAPTPAEIEKELRQIDETLHNIDGCILQLQGKLLTQRS